MNQAYNDELTPKEWKDQDGRVIPTKLVTPYERNCHRVAVKYLRRMQKLEQEMRELKLQCSLDIQKLQDQFCADRQVDPTSGFTISSYDKGIKLERTRNVAITFDPALLDASKQKFDQYLDAVTGGQNEEIGILIRDAFTQVKGKPDAKKLMGLLKFRERIKNPLFLEALNLLESSTGRGNSKMYFKTCYRQNDGSYRYVNVDFASL